MRRPATRTLRPCGRVCAWRERPPRFEQTMYRVSRDTMPLANSCQAASAAKWECRVWAQREPWNQGESRAKLLFVPGAPREGYFVRHDSYFTEQGAGRASEHGP